MRALDRKLIRDLWQMKGQAIAICLVMACGVATFVMSLSTLGTLQRTRDAYYERYRFGQVFAHLKRAPNALAERIETLPGVAQVQTRVVMNVTLDVEGMAEPAVGRLISIPERQESGLNRLYLRSGRYVEPGREGEVLVSEGFAVAHRLQPGDRIQAILNARRQWLRIVGVALSPEYIYQIREGDILPDDRRFGVFWMGYTELAAAFDMQGAFNDVALTMSPEASEPDVLGRLDRLTAPYGGLGAIGRSDQPSHRFVENEISELRGMGVVAPAIFLSVAAFLLHVVVSRLVNTQREQIAALKAFGYTRGQVAGHYLKLVLLIVTIGVALGSVVGARLGYGLAELYTRFFRFPVFTFHLDPLVLALAFLLSVTAGVAGTLEAVFRATRLPPAEAMRPEPPATYRRTLLERIGLQRLVSAPTRMILRHLERRPIRSLLSCFGIAVAVAVLILGYFAADAIDYVMESQFQFAEREDVTIQFMEPRSSHALSELYALPGVRHGEGFRSLPVRLRAGHRMRRLGILAVEPEGKLYRLLDVRRQAVGLPPDGLVLSHKLAELLDVRPGDSVVMEVLEADRPARTVAVASLIDDFAGLSAYMDLQAANRLMHEGTVLSGAFLAVEQDQMDQLYGALKTTPGVAGVTVKKAALTSFRQTVAENLLRMRLFNILFSGIIAFGVIYNTARITVSERSRELATLRVMGFTRGEISMILLGELALLTLVAIPLGMALGYGLAAAVIRLAYDTELFRIPLLVTRSTYGFAVSVTLAAALLSRLAVRRMLDRLDLIPVLKSKE